MPVLEHIPVLEHMPVSEHMPVLDQKNSLTGIFLDPIQNSVAAGDYCNSFIFHRFRKAMTVSVLHMNVLKSTKMLVGTLDLKYVSAQKNMKSRRE